MRNLLKIILAAAASLAMAAASAAPITYNVNLSIGNGTATGEITTDGTIGAVGVGNILSYSLLLAPSPGDQFTLDEGNSAIAASTSLAATLDFLTFDFSQAGYWLMQAPNPGSGVNYLCFTSGTLCGGISDGMSMATNVWGADSTSLRGVQVVGTAGNSVPEPSSIALAGLALLAIGAARRRRQA